MAAIRYNRRMVLAGLALIAARPALAQERGWLIKVEAALAAHRPGSGPVSRLDLALSGGVEVSLRQSADVAGFMAEIAKIEARAPGSGSGYDPARGTNRFTQRLPDGRSSHSEHWMGHDHSLRMITVTAADPALPTAMLDEFAGFRAGGGFGGPPLLTPPLTAP